MDFNQFVYWCETLITGFAKASDWLTHSVVQLGDISFSPFSLLTFGGLSAYLVIAIVNWAIK